MFSWSLGFLWPVGIRCKSPSVADFQRSSLPYGKLSVRVCTKGTSPKLVRETTLANVNLLKRSTLPWLVEVVTDNFLDLEGYFRELGLEPERVKEIVVPQWYDAPSGCKYKARALHYANQDGVSQLGDNDFIVHLDEETILDETSVAGMCDFIWKHPDRVGQGMILYGRGPVINPITTTADCIRVTDDYCRFRVCFTLGYPLQGMHGSYVVVNSGIEREVGFDYGPSGSITEDAVFALAAMQRGIKFGFVDGFMHEKSPFTFCDFLKQRRRWLQGLWLTVGMSWLHLKTKLLLAVSVFAWSIAPVGSLAFAVVPFISHFYGGTSHIVLIALRTFLCGTVSWVYLWGALLNYSWASQRYMYPVYVIMTGVLTPLCWMMEVLAVVYGLCTFNKSSGFYVVQKEYDSLDEIDPSAPLNPTDDGGERRDSMESGIKGSTAGDGFASGSTLTSSSRGQYERLAMEPKNQ